VKKQAPCASRARIASCARSANVSALSGRRPAGGPSTAASSRKYSATLPLWRPSGPAPTHTTSPDAHSWSSQAAE
jgi:hypothetical protein